jgi:hypothetical protein
MRTAVLGFLIVVGLVVAGWASNPQRGEGVPPQVPLSQLQSTMANAEMIVASATVGEKFQQLAIIDTKLRVMSVYQVDFSTGAIALKSVRNFQYDQQMTQFNAKEPLPDDLRALIPSR